MEHQLILREFRKEDTEALENIVKEAWHYEEFTSPRVAKKLAAVFFHSCLANQTYTQVAVWDGAPVGVIMGKNIALHRCPPRYRLRLWRKVLSLYCSKEGRKTVKIFGSVSNIDQELLRAYGNYAQGEVAFFAVDAKLRGKGVGKKLFQSLLEYMKSQNISTFYLFTDTSCNYGFYEHQGMERKQEKEHRFQLNHKEQDMKFFLYEWKSC